MPAALAATIARFDGNAWEGKDPDHRGKPPMTAAMVAFAAVIGLE
ncbi:hypothetical protein BVG79_00448 [Ketogulonicigenium robustum]|uniref:Uncharacterized protein n=1 Tax=Ketogulonicigenium robustum TaxID=92947 RepID=A0A1W6NX35_9RHOB|nr:hypothetical protein [Ketogulonicigenium robustum]ARO13802.1 hypothetical protein BVG79_00448 [Ketogulonicigenium robustum]